MRTNIIINMNVHVRTTKIFSECLAYYRSSETIHLWYTYSLYDHNQDFPGQLDAISYKWDNTSS